MKKFAVIVSAICMLAAPLLGIAANPEQDLKDFRKYYTERFPDTPLQDFTNGVYAVDKASREQWEAFEEFPLTKSMWIKAKSCSIQHLKMAKALQAAFRQLPRV